MTPLQILKQETHSIGISSRMLKNGNGLEMHILEAGSRDNNTPCVILLHGFPELAYSWRKIMPSIADEGYYVVAPDQRGYGLTKGWTAKFEDDLAPFRMNNLVEDIVGLLHALDFQEAIVVGHDFGSPVAASCALTRSDIFRGLCLMSAPFSGFPVRTSNDSETSNNPDQDAANIHEDLATLSRPRKHYQWYYATREANNDMMKCPQGVHSFLRAYYHHKSADWAQNTPSTLSSWTAEELAKLPTYYVMDMERTMPQTVASEMPTPKQIKDCAWLTEAELNVYSSIYSETGFQGGLQWYRCSTMGLFDKDLLSHVGKTVDIPSCFMAGKNDWGVYQRPGAFETMQEWALSDFRSCHLIHNAGHWVQQEQPKPVIDYLVKFLKTI